MPLRHPREVEAEAEAPDLLGLLDDGVRVLARDPGGGRPGFVRCSSLGPRSDVCLKRMQLERLGAGLHPKAADIETCWRLLGGGALHEVFGRALLAAGARVEVDCYYEHAGLGLAGEIDGRLVDTCERSWILEHKCLAGSASILDHSTGAYISAEELFKTGRSATVTALTATGELVATKAAPLRFAGVRPVVRVCTRGGRLLRVSTNHPILTHGGWRLAGEIKPGEYLAVPRQIKCGVADALLPDEAFRLIGYAIGDGHSRRTPQHRLTIAKGAPAVLSDIVRCAAALGDSVYVHPAPIRRQGQSVPYVYFGPESGSNTLALISLAGLTGVKSKDKRIPLHLQPSDRQIGQLLGALWSTDGTICARASCGPTIAYSSRSSGLCQDIQHALQRVGAPSTVTQSSVLYKGSRVPVWTVKVVSRWGKRRFLQLAMDAIIPVTRTALAIPIALSLIPASKYGADSRGQPDGAPADGLWWWDRVASVEQDEPEATYDVNVPDHSTLVVDGVMTHNTMYAKVLRFLKRPVRRNLYQVEGYMLLTGIDRAILHYRSPGPVESDSIHDLLKRARLTARAPAVQGHIEAALHALGEKRVQPAPVQLRRTYAVASEPAVRAEILGMLEQVTASLEQAEWLPENRAHCMLCPFRPPCHGGHTFSEVKRAAETAHENR